MTTTRISVAAAAEQVTTAPYDEILKEAAGRAQRYLQIIRERHAGVTEEALQHLAALGGPLPFEGDDPSSVLKLLDEAGSPALPGCSSCLACLQIAPGHS